jgi:hypothetical protein
MKQTLNIIGYALTPPAFFINLAEWLDALSINQTFTIIISIFVVIFWAFKARKEYLACQVEKRKLEQMG